MQYGYSIMAYLHWRRQTRIQTQTRIPNLMATKYYEHLFHMAQTEIQIVILIATDRNAI